MCRRKELKFEIVGDCKICVSHKQNDNGYIRYQIDGKSHRLHRLVWEQHHGEIPKGYFLSHICGDTRCMNIEHMELLDVKEKGKKMVDKGKSNRGEDRHNAKLTEEDVISIRRMSYKSDQALSNQFGVTAKHINAIKNYKAWKHIS